MRASRRVRKRGVADGNLFRSTTKLGNGFDIRVFSETGSGHPCEIDFLGLIHRSW